MDATGKILFWSKGAEKLFGYVKGALTGAVRSHAGLFQRAHSGTLFLDETAVRYAGMSSAPFWRKRKNATATPRIAVAIN